MGFSLSHQLFTKLCLWPPGTNEKEKQDEYVVYLHNHIELIGN